MFAKELIGIVQEALDRKGSDNPLDRILVSAFVSTRSGGNKYQELFANPHFAEIRTLFARVLDPSRSGAEEAAAAILAYRDTIAAEIAGDKLMGISASRQIIKHVASIRLGPGELHTTSSVMMDFNKFASRLLRAMKNL
jgi:hypothetical protein